VKKITLRLTVARGLALFGALGALLSCGFENKADIEVYVELYEYSFVKEHAARKAEVLNAAAPRMAAAEAAVNAAVANALNEYRTAITTVQGRTKTARSPTTATSSTQTQPGTWPQACCWATATSANRAPNDTGPANTYSDNNYPRGATTQLTETNASNITERWASNYQRGSNEETAAHTNAIDTGHWITFDLTANYNIVGFRYRGRPNNVGGKVTGLDLYVSQENDLARGSTPTTSNDAELPGHRPPSEKLVPHNQTQWPAGQGDNGWYPTTATPTNIVVPAYGRYVQFRMNKPTVGGNQREKGASGLQIITVGSAGDADQLADVRANMATAEDTARETASAEQLVLIFASMAESGYGNLAIDFSYLEAAYQQGIQLLGSLRLQPVKYRKLDEALNGKLNDSGAVLVRGGAQYLSGEFPPPQPVSLSYFNDFFDYQDEVDAVTQEIIALLEAPPMAQ